MPFLTAIDMIKRDLRIEQENTDKVVTRRQRTRTQNPDSAIRKALKSIGVRPEDLRRR